MFGTIFVAQERYVSQFLFFDVKRVYSRFDENGLELIFQDIRHLAFVQQNGAASFYEGNHAQHFEMRGLSTPS